MSDIYGDSFGNLQANITADASLRQRGLESALGNALSSLSQMRNRQMLADQFAKTMAEKGQQLAAEKEHWQQQSLDNQKQLDAMKDLRDAEAAHYRAMTDTPPAKQRSQALEISLASQAANAGNFDPTKYKELPENVTQALKDLSDASDARNVAEYNRAHGLANAWNSKAENEDTIAKLNSENKKLGDVSIWNAGLKGSVQAHVQAARNKATIDRLTQENQLHDRTLKPFADSKFLDRYISPSQSDPSRVEPAVPTPFSLQRRSAPAKAPVAAPAAAPAPARTAPDDGFQSANALFRQPEAPAIQYPPPAPMMRSAQRTVMVRDVQGGVHEIPAEALGAAQSRGATIIPPQDLP